MRFQIRNFNYWHVVWKEWTSFFDTSRKGSKIMTPSLRRFYKLICKFVEINAINVHELQCCLLGDDMEGIHPIDSHDGSKHNISIICFFLMQSFEYFLEVKDPKLL